MAAGREVFHWSGKNSERARNLAAHELYRHIRGLEKQGHDVHLVGHSHGGSVIWHMLKQATLHREPLRRLRSWTTVGTPFLQHKSRSPWNPINVAGMLVGCVLLIPLTRAVMGLLGLVWAAIMGQRPRVLADHYAESGVLGFYERPFHGIMQRCGVAVESCEEGIMLGSFDPMGTETFASYLFGSWEGFVFLAALLIHILVIPLLVVWSVAPTIESYRIRVESRLEAKAYQRFGSRWLGLWSRDDEAINGLRATLDLNLKLVGKMMPRQRVFISDTPRFLSQPLYWIAAPIYNRWIHPIVDRVVRDIVIRNAQGNDRPTAMLIQVTATPMAQAHDRFAALPPGVTEKILQYADSRARNLGPSLRRWLGQPLAESSLQRLGGDLTGHELVHTSYFEHPEIAYLICCNAALGTVNCDLPQGRVSLSEELIQWFQQTKHELNQDCDPDPIRKDAKIPRNVSNSGLPDQSGPIETGAVSSYRRAA